MSWRDVVAAQQTQQAEVAPAQPAQPQAKGGWREEVARRSILTGAAQNQSAQSAGMNPVQARAASVMPSTGALLETPSGGYQGAALPPRVQDATDTPASLVAKAALADDPQVQIRLFAERRFPNEPDAAQKRYGIIDGDIVFRADDGELYREVGTLGNEFADAIGSSGLQAVGGMVGAALGNAPGAGLGGGFGESLRKMIANLVLGEKQTPLGNALDIGAEAVLSAGGQKIGESVVGGAINRQSARDLARFDRSRAQGMMAAGQAEGVPLTAAEASRLPSLLSLQKVLQKTHGSAGDVMGEFMETRARQQIPAAIERQIGPAGQPAEVVGQRLKGAAEGAITAATRARSAQSSPIYRQAFDAGYELDPSDAIKFIDEQLGVAKGKGANRLREVRRMLVSEDEAGNQVVDTSVEGLHNVKVALDEMVTNAKKAQMAGNEPSIDSLTRGRLSQVSQKIDGILSDVPEYQAARRVHAQNSPVVDELKNSVVGTLARIKDNATEKAALKLFDPSVSARQIAIARKALEAQDPALWDEALNLYLRNAWTRASREGAMGQSGNVGGQFRRLVFGTDTQREALREALGPQRYAGFSRLMDVLEATTQAQGGQSITAFAQGGERAARGTAAPIATKAGPFNLREWWIDMRTEAWKERMANALTSGQGLDELKQLRKLSPRSEKAIGVATQFLLNSGAATANELVYVPPEKVPAR